MKKEAIIQRLAFIQYLNKTAIEKSKEPEPYCWASILTFQDAVELFLELVAEELDISKKLKDLKFYQYWDSINPALKEKGKNDLTQRIQMEKLNDARVALKHHGTPPSKSTIEAARVNVTDFFEENTSTVFCMKFSEISLVDFIQCDSAKKSLIEAKNFISDNDIDDALDKVAVAFEELVDDYEDRKRDTWGYSPFFFGQDLTFKGDSFTGRKVTDTIISLQRAVKVISLGLDFRKYSKFRLITSVTVFKPIGGGYIIQRGNRTTEAPTMEDFLFCIDFVIESSIVLKEFDFDVIPKKRKPFGNAFNT
jgi:hypothetical protein